MNLTSIIRRRRRMHELESLVQERDAMLGITEGKITLEMSAEAVVSLVEFIEQTKDTPAEFFRKALNLYKLASDARREGKAVGAAASPEALETEFVGF